MAPFSRSVSGFAVQVHLVLTVVGSLIAPAAGHAGLIAGLWAVWAWVSLNVFMIDRLLRWSVSGDPADKKKVVAVCMIKFPVLYVGGFFIVLSRPVTLQGVFAGLTLFIVSMTCAWTYFAFLKKKEV